MGFWDNILGGGANLPEAKEKQREERNAIRIQDFFNKFSIKSKELDTSAVDRAKIESGMWQGYSWLIDKTATADERSIRYREYREMCKVPELNQGLSIYSDNATQYDVENKVLKIESENARVVEILNNLFFDVLDINGNLWGFARNMCKFGDEFVEVVVDDKSKPEHVISIERIKKPENMWRIEDGNNLVRFEYHIPKYKSGYAEYLPDVRAFTEEEVQNFQPWQIVHFKIEDEEFAPYGKSILEAGRRTFKKMSLMEDAMLIYRISRAPERRVFYIDVGTLSTKEANKFIEQVKRQFKKKKYINPNTGEVDEKLNPMSTDEDFFIPVRQNSQGTRIETLPGGVNLGEVDDVKYFRDQILRTMGIPVGYLGGQAGEGATYDPKSYLSNQEIQFARTIERVQRLIIRGLEKIAIVELAFNKIPEKELKNFKITLTPPSNVDKLMDIEIRTQQFQLVQSIRSIVSNDGIPFLPDEWLYKTILGMNDQDISKLKLQVQMQMQMQNQIKSMFAPAGEGGMAGGAGGGMGTAPAVAGGPPEVGGEMGAGGAPPEAGMPGGEVGAAGAPAAGGEAGGAGPGLEIASRSTVQFDGGKWLFESKADMQKLLKYIKLYEKVHKDNTTTVKRELKNDLTRMTIKGEFRGLLKAYKNPNAQALNEKHSDTIK